MGRLLLARHGESEGNVPRRFTLSPDVPITARGRDQVEATGQLIQARFAPTRIVSSPFRRAQQTAEILAALWKLPVGVEPELRERSYGELAGHPYTAARATPGYDIQRYWEWQPPGGETLIAVVQRAGGVLDRVRREHPHEDVLVVSHGAVMLALWRHVMGEWSRAGVTGNAGLIVVEHTPAGYAGASPAPID